MLFLILPILNILGINIIPGQDAFSPTVPFDKNKHYSMSALCLLCCCIMITNIMRKKFIGWWVPIPMKPIGFASLAACVVLSGLVTLDTYHRVLAAIPKKEEDKS